MSGAAGCNKLWQNGRKNITSSLPQSGNKQGRSIVFMGKRGNAFPDERMISNMKKLLAMALAMALILTCAMACAEATPVPSPAPAMPVGTPEPAPLEKRSAQITVQGTAQIAADPDIVNVTANAEVTAKTVGEAQEQIGAIVESVTAKLLELGVLDEDIVTQNYSYYPVYNYDTDTPTLTGYRASHTLAITCRDTDMLDGVIGAATDNGMSEIYGVNYDVSARAELYQQALELAIEAAERKAARMAGASGMTLTGLVSLTENGGYSERYAVNESADMAKLTAGAAATGIRSGSVSITASVTAVYEAGK